MNTKKIVMPQRSISSMRSKLYSAVAMLLVASTLLVTSSYAWFVMSTAPEVTGIQTQVGANGALEIALLDSVSWNDLSRLDMGDIDENADGQTTQANLTWGNLVDLNSATYGLSQITLLPSRLFISASGEASDTFEVNKSTLLKTPVYGEDGRVKGLEAKAVSKIFKDNAFGTNGYGVRAVGTAADMSTFQLGMNSARTQISNATSAARSAAQTALNTNGGNMASIVVAYAINGREEGFTKEDVANIKKLAEDIEKSLDQIEAGLRQAYAGYVATAASGVTADNYQTALDEINNTETALTALAGKYANAISNGVKLSEYVAKLDQMRADVNSAKDKCDKEPANAKDYTWSEISGIVQPLVNIDSMTVGGKRVNDLKKELKNEDGSINFNAAFNLLQGGGITITVPTGSGLLSDIADFAGDYTAKVKVENVTVGTIGTVSPVVTMETATTENPAILTKCSNALAASELIEVTSGSNTITDFYGYAIDLAFRTNAEGSHLQLQTEPVNRIYNDGSSANEALQGGGSYMTFATQAGLSATKMVKLMNGIRVVFMDKQQKVLGIAKLDTTLARDDYTVISDEFRTQNGIDAKYHAYLTGLNREGSLTYQKSDLITKEDYDALLPGNGAVIFDTASNTVSARLYIYKYSLTMADTVDENGEITGQHLTGGLTIGNKADNANITALDADIPQVVTALVYLDGSVVNNSMVAASALQSMTGTLNLQFSSDVTLMPAQNTELRDGSKNNSQDGSQSGNQDEGTGTTG